MELSSSASGHRFRKRVFKWIILALGVINVYLLGKVSIGTKRSVEALAPLHYTRLANRPKVLLFDQEAVSTPLVHLPIDSVRFTCHIVEMKNL